jgi:hypothetical protein
MRLPEVLSMQHDRWLVCPDLALQNHPVVLDPLEGDLLGDTRDLADELRSVRLIEDRGPSSEWRMNPYFAISAAT